MTSKVFLMKTIQYDLLALGAVALGAFVLLTNKIPANAHLNFAVYLGIFLAVSTAAFSHLDHFFEVRLGRTNRLISTDQHFNQILLKCIVALGLVFGSVLLVLGEGDIRLVADAMRGNPASIIERGHVLVSVAVAAGMVCHLFIYGHGWRAK